jgi:hypothetical protein
MGTTRREKHVHELRMACHSKSSKCRTNKVPQPANKSESSMVIPMM